MYKSKLNHKRYNQIEISNAMVWYLSYRMEEMILSEDFPPKSESKSSKAIQSIRTKPAMIPLS